MGEEISGATLGVELLRRLDTPWHSVLKYGRPSVLLLFLFVNFAIGRPVLFSAPPANPAYPTDNCYNGTEYLLVVVAVALLLRQILLLLFKHFFLVLSLLSFPSSLCTSTGALKNVRES